MLYECATAREVSEEGLMDWLDREGLRNPDYVLGVLLGSLEKGVGEENWLFNRSEFK